MAHTIRTPRVVEIRFLQRFERVLLILRLRVAARYAIWIDR
jgi:hypothetical protein